MHVDDIGAKYDDGTMAAVISRIGKLERISAGNLELSLLVARESHAREGHRVIEELQLIALAGRAPCPHRALARLQAIAPEQGTDDDQHYREAFPHRPIIGRRPALSGRRLFRPPRSRRR